MKIKIINLNGFDYLNIKTDGYEINIPVEQILEIIFPKKYSIPFIPTENKF